MRGTRGLILLAILALVAVIASTYFVERAKLARDTPEVPPPLDRELDASAEDWQWSQSEGGRPVVEVRARNFRQVREPSFFDLEDVELRIYKDAGTTYDRVRSASAAFDLTAKSLYSEGRVVITLDVPAGEPPKGKLVSIASSGVHFDSATGKARTDRFAEFEFSGGEGRAVGATYDPQARQLELFDQVALTWRGESAETPPLRVEAARLRYTEAEHKIFLYEWSRLSRENLVLEGADAVLTLEEGVIRLIESWKVTGSDRQPNRSLRYGADEARATLSPQGQVEQIDGAGNTRLVSSSRASETTVTSARFRLNFEAGAVDSELRTALALDGAKLEVDPRAQGDQPPADRQILESEVIELTMRPGGEQVELIATHAPGVLRFEPRTPEGERRTLWGERFWIHYGKANQLEMFRAARARTRTERPPAKDEEAAPPPVETSSDSLLARFDPATGDLAQLEQWERFEYREGPQRASAERAVFDAGANRMRLEGKARVWDPQGNLSAARIDLDKTTGDIEAEGQVASTRLPDAKPASKNGAEDDAGAGLLGDSEPMHATAAKMATREQRGVVRYEGEAVVWQGQNRVEGKVVEIWRSDGRLEAEGAVRTLLEEARSKPETPAGTSGSESGPPRAARAAPRRLLVSADHLVYQENGRRAVYTGHVFMRREDLEVRSHLLTALFAEGDAGTELERAVAEGDVRVAIPAPGRARNGTGERGEYYSAEEKIVLYGKDAEFVDSLRGTTRGAQLTYFTVQDTLLVEGSPQRPAATKMRRK